MYIPWKLFKKACTGQLESDEQRIFDEWYHSDRKNRSYFQKAKAFYSESDSDFFEENKAEEGYQEFLERIKDRKNNLRSFLGMAAGILLIISFAVFYYVNLPSRNELSAEIQHIVPGKSQATLTLSNGEKVFLEDLDSIHSLEDHGEIIEVDSAVLKYSASNEAKTGVLALNTLEIPHGGEYHLTLSDGTEVWLNSESKLIYPVSFPSSIREVTLSGEGFFKVAANKAKPFVVHNGNSDVSVYGTSFNISNYENDNHQEVTLNEGVVRISNMEGLPGKEIQLSPDQQFTLIKESHETSVRNVDAGIFSAWTRGTFVFEDETIEQVFKKLGRWYDIDVQYGSNEVKNEKLSGTLPRFEDFGIIVKLVEQVSVSDIEIKGNKILIK